MTYLNLGWRKGDEYIAKDCAHLVNMWLWAQWGPNSILQQVNKPSRKRNQKIIQFKSMFHILSHGCLMLEYETMHDLFASLKTRYGSRKKSGSFYFLGYLLELSTKLWWFRNLFFWNLENLGLFSMENPLYWSKSYFSGRNLAKFQKKITLHLRCLLSSWMNDNCAEVYGFVTGVSISSRAALKVRVPGSASTLCRPLIRITELPSGFTPCPPPHKALPDFL